MADSNKKVQPYTSFNAGEYSPELAGRVDLESFGSSSRFMSNMMSQISGGIKKFYGTTHVAEVTPEEGRGKVRFVPFINKYEPMVLVFWGLDDREHDVGGSIKVGLIYGDKYAPLNIEVPSLIDVNDMRWKQVNDTIVFVHKRVQPFAIRFYGVDDDNEYVFVAENIAFSEIPYFPIDTTDGYRGRIVASAVTGTIELTFPGNEESTVSLFPVPLDSQATYTRSYSTSGRDTTTTFTADPSTISLIRVRNGVETTLVSGVCNATTVGN